MTWCWPASRVHRIELLILQVLMLHWHSPAFNFAGEIREGTDFWPVTQIKCNEEKKKILYWITCLLSSFFFFFPSCISVLNMETSDILLQTFKKTLNIVNEKLDPFSCQPVLSIVFYLGQEFLQLKIVRSLYLAFSSWQDKCESRKCFPMAVSCGYNSWWHILNIFSSKTHRLTPVWVG